MRLSKIKLAGFKSFVDPISFHLRSNLNCVVGPNGCGKSNVIDAVRWVMGESSAKHLRGDSMADVIFNGSTQRKPVGQASVELLFDNSEGKLGGQYAQYNEISIKRVVSRDGTSTYHLNNSRCRRKDITSIFLGTGLGARSYAIIEQGMISRLIEAKPEELRVFIEEAAGISKYKERRRETENRIRHTRENLERLLDLKDEIEKQLEKLKRQARTAARYKEMKQEERLLKAQLLALRLTRMQEENQVVERRIAEQQNVVEKEVAELRRIESELEQGREQQVEATDVFNEVQGRFYSIGSDIARVEQSIQHTKERRQQQQQDLEEVDRGLAESQSHLDMDQRQIADMSSQLEQIEPQSQQAKENAERSSLQLEQSELAMNTWQSNWEQFNELSSHKTREADVLRNSIQHREEQVFKLQERISRLEEELGGLTLEMIEEEIRDLEASLQEVTAEQQQKQEELQELLQAIGHQRELVQDATHELDDTRNQLQQLRGRHASLEALQQAALGKNAGAVSEWLGGQGLGQNLRLAEGIEASAGWERAVETVLGFNLEAVCTEGLDPLTSVLESLEEGSLAVFETGRRPAPGGSTDKAQTILQKIRTDLPLQSMVHGIYAVDDLASALALRGQLDAGESVITKDGVWIGPNWLKVARDADEKQGVLVRETELKSLATKIHALTQQEADLRQRIEHNRDLLHSKEEDREELQHQINDINRRHGEIRSAISGKQAHYEQLRQRGDRVREELTDLVQQVSNGEQELSVSRQNLEQLINELDELNQQRDKLNNERQDRHDHLQQAREQANLDREQAHELTVRIQSLRSSLETSRQSMVRVESQLQQLVVRQDQIKEAISSSERPLADMQQELETLLSKRVEVEAELSDARKMLEDIDHSIRELSEGRHEVEQKAQSCKDELDQTRLNAQELKVRIQTIVEQLTETGHQLEQLMTEMPEQANVESWQESVNTLEAKIQRLGPINLAAIDEFKEQQERKEYLDSQHADLAQALDTLETAIGKIDKETKAKFRDTFDQVNAGLKEKFPRVFGGGSAYLELTEEDELTAGVTVMARPPGKRNSTIHLLSGGEKALTAIALVFSIFELNPAPFCMLDEVDAPLDDANVGRYCTLIKEMSERTQFIFITHNKITMEMAGQLNGVTMQEPGVSRLVAVDVDEAVELAAV